MRRKTHRSYPFSTDLQSPTFYLHHESPQTNQAKAVLMDIFAQVEPNTNCQELNSWGNLHVGYPMAYSNRDFLHVQAQSGRVSKQQNNKKKLSDNNRFYQNGGQNRIGKIEYMKNNSSDLIRKSKTPFSHTSRKLNNSSAISSRRPISQPQTEQGIKKKQNGEQKNGSIWIKKYFIEHLYKNKRKQQAMIGRRCFSRDGNLDIAGYKGRRQHLLLNQW